MEFNDEKLNQIATVAYSFRETVYHTYECAKEVIRRNVGSCMIECGIASGGNILAMQQAIVDSYEDIKLYGYDSFEGIPLAGPEDTSQPGIGDITHDVNLPLEDRLVSSGITVHSEASVITNFQRFQLPTDNLELVGGWFQDTLPEHSKSIERISLLRLDGDLYESTMVCLDYLYPKLSVGGICIVDDYQLPGARKSVVDYFEKIGEQFPDMIEVPNSGGVVHFNKR